MSKILPKRSTRKKQRRIKFNSSKLFNEKGNKATFNSMPPKEGISLLHQNKNCDFQSQSLKNYYVTTTIGL